MANTKKYNDWGTHTHKTDLEEWAVPENVFCINFVYLHHLLHIYMHGISLE
jgi:hypothetical protein